MARITELALQGVRCFAKEQSAKLGRIALLVGENGSGKSTFLGCYRSLAKLANLIDLRDENHFDDEPFGMGDFTTVARSGSSHFSIGGTFEGHCHTGATFMFECGRRGEPVERHVGLKYGARRDAQDLRVSRESPGGILRFDGPNFQFRLRPDEISYNNISSWLSNSVRRGTLPFAGEIENLRRWPNAVDSNEVEFGKLVNHFRSVLPLPAEYAFDFRPVFPSVPRERAVVARPTYSEDPEALAEIGKKLGLWQAIEVLGRSDGRFEILVTTPSGKHNIADVGFGVHSLLPLANALACSPEGAIFLLEQPEVHVHPSAQARLADLMAESNHTYVIETHSDHLVNHFVICVMEGMLDPEELSVVYFEPNEERTESLMHTIVVDIDGNLKGAPKGYREFFLKETHRRLGIGE